MNRPKIKIEKNVFDKSIEILTFLLIIVSVILIVIYYKQLPEKLPIHFNWPSKDQNGFGTKDLLWANPVICGIIGIAIYKLNQYPWIFNYPTKIIEENAKYNYKMSTQMLRIIGLIIGFICLSLTLTSILNGLGNKTGFEKYFEPLFPILLVGMPVLYIFRILMNKKNRHNNIYSK